MTLHLVIKGNTLAKPNYQFEKRQRDLAKKKKQEEKRQKKAAANKATGGGDQAMEAATDDTIEAPSGDKAHPKP